MDRMREECQRFDLPDAFYKLLDRLHARSACGGVLYTLLLRSTCAAAGKPLLAHRLDRPFDSSLPLGRQVGCAAAAAAAAATAACVHSPLALIRQVLRPPKDPALLASAEPPPHEALAHTQHPRSASLPRCPSPPPQVW